MIENVEEIVRQRIVEKHQRDEKQLEVVFSPSKRILVEAPAGYGKTNTMVSKIAFMIATKQIPSPKRLLALTFSVNAAYKIKKDVTQQLPELLAGTDFSANPSQNIFVSNYHGFCRNVLKKYGSVFHSNLSAIDTMQSIDDSDTRHTQVNIDGISYNEANFLSEYSIALKAINTNFLNEQFNRYCDTVISELLPQNYISYNGILALTLRLFQTHPKILEFYQKYFIAVLVDEFQDTNSLSYLLIEKLISRDSRIILLGDSLQRIYGFIGAVPDLLTKSQTAFGLTKITLDKNYRFASNPQMLQLDFNIRRNAENPRNPAVDKEAKIELTITDNQTGEAGIIISKAVELSALNGGSRVAVLVKQRGPNVDAIINAFKHNNISFFYGLFTDEDVNYVNFHRKCLYEFIELLRLKPRITKKLAAEHVKKIGEVFQNRADSLINALMNLLQIFWSRLFSDFSSFSEEEKILLIKDTFEHNSLKQYIEFIASNIIISTVHAAKGLEWDYVILPDMEQDSFPSWMSLCGNCGYKSNCNVSITTENETKFLEELSVFYVAVTRARRQVYFTASRKNIDKQSRAWDKNLSCLLKLKGIAI